ncbi:hypothetical protein [Variovorax sp. dw_954]|uniref:hypothetical protein n=1 Tax=Variovorax sp. dw_954 TaxID=2720078 RepID=UPI001BD40B86|nr:hypothetical protein [Variovorax sp. dw_954]
MLELNDSESPAPCDGLELEDTDLHVGALRAAPSVEEQPIVELCQWRAYALEGNVILNGFFPDSPTIRTTTAVATVVDGYVVTSSGRRYLLIGEPSQDLLVLALLEEKMRLAGHANFVDVSAAFQMARVLGGLTWKQQ